MIRPCRLLIIPVRRQCSPETTFFPVVASILLESILPRSTDMDELTSLEAVILAAIADRARYGYELVQRVAELTDGRVNVRPGNLYRILYRLSERGLARELGEPGTDED